MKLRLPATSANLGPGFDALALALKIYLDVEAEAAEQVSVEATGRRTTYCWRPIGRFWLVTGGRLYRCGCG